MHKKVFVIFLHNLFGINDKKSKKLPYQKKNPIKTIVYSVAD
jgi:hypothetical protein